MATEKTNAEPTGRRPEFDEQLARKIEDRLKKGLAPPAEIYNIQNRHKIDWSSVPEWALPIDPDLFEGCAHEG